MPPVIGHRGAAGLAPENTLAGFRRAAASGCRMVEFDVRLSADGVPVVIHDDDLARTTDGTGPVAARTVAALRRLDAGAWFAPAFAGERIPTLGEALSACAALGLGVNIEVKGGGETAGPAIAVAKASWPADLPPPLISSFDDTALAVAAERAPDWPRGLLVEVVPKDWRRRAEISGCAAVHVDAAALEVEAVAGIRGAGYAVLAYTIADRARAEILWSQGVVSVFTDCLWN